MGDIAFKQSLTLYINIQQALSLGKISFQSFIQPGLGDLFLDAVLLDLFLSLQDAFLDNANLRDEVLSISRV